MKNKEKGQKKRNKKGRKDRPFLLEAGVLLFFVGRCASDIFERRFGSAFFGGGFFVLVDFLIAVKVVAFTAVGDFFPLGFTVHEIDGFIFFVYDHALVATNEIFFQRVERNTFNGDFTQAYNRVFVVVAVDSQCSAGADLAGALGSHHDQFKTVLDFLDAVFNGNACH